MQHIITYQKLIARGYKNSETIQQLWSGYGSIVRMDSSNEDSIVLKHINPPHQANHPRGWNTDVGHQRKLKSYVNELNFYKSYADNCNENCKVPQLLSTESKDQEHLIVLEDLNSAGYPQLKSRLALNEVKVVLRWLANFHATFMLEEAKGLWPIGSYWHLATRQEEFRTMHNSDLKLAASKIDQVLNDCQFQTIIHGDAKLANFCFGRDGQQVAAVDFQYTGKGCGMKDVVYFLGSCLTDKECANYESEFVECYFTYLEQALKVKKRKLNFEDLEKEWRKMYAFAWADFHRFLLGWMPSHQKLTNYSRHQVEIALRQINFRN